MNKRIRELREDRELTQQQLATAHLYPETNTFTPSSVWVEVFILKKMLFIILFSALMGCQSADLVPTNNITHRAPVPSAALDAEADNAPVSIQLSLPEQVKVNESFTMEAELKNTSAQTFEIMTGKRVFYFVIRDSNGNSDPILRTDIGVVRPLGQNKTILEKHSHRFKNPGVYEVSAVAEFSLLGEDENNQIYKLETDPKKIEVIE